MLRERKRRDDETEIGFIDVGKVVAAAEDPVIKAQCAAALCFVAMKLDHSRDAVYWLARAEHFLGFHHSAQKHYDEVGDDYNADCSKLRKANEKMMKEQERVFSKDEVMSTQSTLCSKFKGIKPGSLLEQLPKQASLKSESDLFATNRLKVEVLTPESPVKVVNGVAATKDGEFTGGDESFADVAKKLFCPDGSFEVKVSGSRSRDVLKNLTVQKLCRLLVDMPIGPKQFKFVSDYLGTRLPDPPIIGSWNMMCCMPFHAPDKNFKYKMESLADLILQEKWNIVALQELPDPDKYQETIQALDQLKTGEIGKIFKGKLDDWQFRGCTVGTEGKKEMIGFAFNSSMWTCEEVVPAQSEDCQDLQFVRSPVQAVFTSCYAVPTGGVNRHYILALSSVHLKAKKSKNKGSKKGPEAALAEAPQKFPQDSDDDEEDDEDDVAAETPGVAPFDALAKTRQEVASLDKVGRQLKKMAAEQRAKADPLSSPVVICAILGDFNLAPIFLGDFHTDPRDPKGVLPQAWTRLKEEGFNPVVSSTSYQATNAYETMLGQEGHCFDNCLPLLVDAAEAGLRLQTTWNLAPYPSHLPSPDDMQKVKDAAQSFEDAIGNGKMLELMGETVNTLRQNLVTATKVYRDYMLDHTSDHRALTFKFGIEPYEGEGR
jgi:hypothetical protein